MDRASIDNVGEQAPFLLVHGLIGTLRDLVPVFSRRGIDSHAPDLLGYGTLQGVAPSELGLHHQAGYLARWMDEHGFAQVRLLGHSVGGAVAVLFAHAYPERVASLVSVEGNFSLGDAFWSASVARMSADEADKMMTTLRGDLPAWLLRSGIAPEPHHLATAERLLANQPASTVQAVARSVVTITGAPEYEQAARAVFGGPSPTHLVAGKRSRNDWHVPEWALAAAASETLLAGGHLMMVEYPDQFVASVVELSSSPPSGRKKNGPGTG